LRPCLDALPLPPSRRSPWGAAPIDIPGAARAVIVTGTEHPDMIYVSDGSNLATLSGTFSAAQLGALAVSVFAAIGT
jgi:hypothetical protein